MALQPSFTQRPIRTVVRNLLLAIVLTGLIALIEPYIEMTLYTVRLASLPAPDTLAIPVDRVRATAPRATWQAARSNGRRHEGMDIFALHGTPVRSTTDGVVMRRTGERPPFRRTK